MSGLIVLGLYLTTQGFSWYSTEAHMDSWVGAYEVLWVEPGGQLHAKQTLSLLYYHLQCLDQKFCK